MPEAMLRMAMQLRRRVIAESRVAQRAADGHTIPCSGQSFDRVLAGHTLYLWPEPVACLREVYRVMQGGARFVLCFGPRDDTLRVNKFPRTVYRFYRTDEVCKFLTDVGFGNIHMAG